MTEESGDILVKRTINWANKQESIDALLLTGSRAENGPIDELSDYDIDVFGNTFEPFLTSSSWMKEIGKVWVYEKCKFDYKDRQIHTRLIIFDGGERIDFSFWDKNLLPEFIKDGLPDDFNLGYKVLLDKNGILKDLPKPTYSGFKEIKPSRDNFLTIIYNFWFEMYSVAKHLHRNELFFVKLLYSEINRIILQMILWCMQSENNWSLKTNSLGKKMQDWVDEDIWQELYKIFPRFGLEDSWEKLFYQIGFFRRISKKAAQNLGYPYPENVDRNLSEFISNLYKK